MRSFDAESRLTAGKIRLSATARFLSTLFESNFAVCRKINRNETCDAGKWNSSRACMCKMIERTFSKICAPSSVNEVAPFDRRIVKSASSCGTRTNQETKRYSTKRECTRSWAHTQCSRWQFVLAMHEFRSLIYFLRSPFITIESTCRYFCIRLHLFDAHSHFSAVSKLRRRREISVDHRKSWVSFPKTCSENNKIQ